MKSIELTKQRKPWAVKIAELESSWASFWFSPIDSNVIRLTRCSVGAISLLLFLGYAFIGRDWFTDQGWFDTSAGAFLAGNGVADTGAEFRITPFYNNPSLVVPVACAGVVASIILMSGRLASIASLVAFLCLMFFHQRAPLLVTTSEPLVSAFLFYLVLVPASIYKSDRGYLATVGLRLIQIHFVIWVVFSLSSMLANEGWWTGESVRRLLEDGQGIIPSSWGTPLLAEILSSLVLVSQGIFLICVARSSWRSYGFWAMLVFATAVLIVLADWMYALTVLAGVLSLSMWPEYLTKRFAVPS